MEDDGYAILRSILDDAFAQAAHGKGKERHANGRDWDRQPIAEIGRMVGPGFNAGQAMKKLQESIGMMQRGDLAAAERELLGAIVYAASVIMLVRQSS